MHSRPAGGGAAHGRVLRAQATLQLARVPTIAEASQRLADFTSAFARQMTARITADYGAADAARAVIRVGMENRHLVRAVDPAGNRDEKYILDRSNGNLHYWQYISPTAWDLIGEGVGGFLALSLFGYLEYRRRKKKAAMERYAMKRMRRKFKAMQRDEEGGIVDWRTLYNENKTQDAAKRKSKKQEREEKKRQREKEKKKRDKEKENIKKKLKAGKDHKDKQKKALEKQEEKKALKSEKKEKKKKKKDKGGAIEDGDGDAGDVKKLKDYEKGDAGDVKKLKDYEKGNVPSGDPAEQGTKQRKSNKRYKDYEMDQEGTGKKDI